MKPPEIKRLPIIQYHDLVIDPQCHTVALSGEEVLFGRLPPGMVEKTQEHHRKTDLTPRPIRG